MALVGVFLSLLLSVYFPRPIRQLGEITLSLDKGDFSRRIKVSRNDEFGDLAYAFNRMAADLELHEKIKDSFGRYVTPEIVQMILSNPDKTWMKGSMVEATVLFVDVRNFTALSENRDPEVVLRLLNDYLTRVTDTVIKYGGHINKFAGDEAMAVFGAPIAKELHAEAAVKAALEIQKQIAELNRQEALGDMKKFPLIARYNGLNDATKIRVGQEIKIPGIEGVPFLVKDKALSTEPEMPEDI